MTRTALLTLALLLALAAPAAAAPTPVATTTGPDGKTITLEAHRQGKLICLDVMVGERGELVGCAAPPTDAEGDAAAVQFAPFGRFGLFVGVVSPRTAVVRVDFARGPTLDLVARDAPGFNTRARFLLGVRTPPGKPTYARAFDPDGQLRAADDIDPFARAPRRGPRLLVHGRLGGLRYRVSALVRTFLDPRPGRPEARRSSPCLAVQADPGIAEENCRDGTSPISANYSGDCDGSPLLFYGTVAARAARVDVIFGRRRHRARLFGLPAAFGFGRQRGWILPARKGSRSAVVESRSRTGRRLERVGLGISADLCGGGIDILDPAGH